MKGVIKSKIQLTIPLLIAVCLLRSSAQAKYSGGTGEPNDPYQIAIAEDLMLLGESPEDYDKHFKLLADIDLSGYTGEEFNIIGERYYESGWVERPFTGVFDGNGHTVSNFSYTSTDRDYAGLFGFVDDPNAQIINLGLVNPDIEAGTGKRVGSLVGWLKTGRIVGCYVEDGSVSGDYSVGGLVGLAGGLEGQTGVTIINSYSTGNISGNEYLGGLIGGNNGTVDGCYSTCNVTGESYVGGLVGQNGAITGYWVFIMISGTISNCYSTGSTSGNGCVGGLVGFNYVGTITNCYATGEVLGKGEGGGLVGTAVMGEVKASFWHIETSGQTTGDGGEGKRTTEMKTAATFLEAGWDFVDETENGTEDIWKISEGFDYPRLWWEQRIVEPIRISNVLLGTGTVEDPYLIYTAEDLNLIGLGVRYLDKHFKLMADINLSGRTYSTAVIPEFAGTFNGNGHMITHFTIVGVSYLGLFGRLESGAEVRDLGIVDVNITSTSKAGSLVGENSGGSIINCYSSGNVSGYEYIGGLVGYNGGSITTSNSTCTVSGLSVDSWWGNLAGIGGLVGYNSGSIAMSCSTGSVRGSEEVGGMVGENGGSVTASCSYSKVQGEVATGGLAGRHSSGNIVDCYAEGEVIGDWYVGGLVGSNGSPVMYGRTGAIHNCYAVTDVIQGRDVGGLLGLDWGGTIINSFWDIQKSGQTESGGGTGLTTAEMQTAITFLEAGWDFVGESENGTEDIWWIDEGQGYPRLWWERDDLFFLVVDDFESYNDLEVSNEIWNTWIDGYDNPNNGSEIGEINPPFVGWGISHTGKESMPYYYNNSGPANYSEATANAANLMAGRDWTKHRIMTLSLWFRRFHESDPWFGGRENEPEPMYVALANINGPAIAVYHDDPNVTQIAEWTKWRIDLQEFADQGVDLTNINTISIGFGYKDNPQPGGSGKMHFDDIRLYRSASEPAP